MLDKYISFTKEAFDPNFCAAVCDNLEHIGKHQFYGVDKSKGTVGKDPTLCKLKTDRYGHMIIDMQYKMVHEYLSTLDMPWFTSWAGYTWPKFIEYNKGEDLKNHCDHIYEIFTNKDGQPNGVPILTMITCLNEDYTGGSMTLCNEYNYTFKTGDTIIFPSNFLYPHSIAEITDGKRVSMTTWIY